jgi:hypothetical protein
MVGSNSFVMDRQTLEVIDRLRVDIRQVEARLTARVDRLDEGAERRFEDTRRHFDVIAENLRDDIRMIAEGLVALSERVETFRR